MGVLIEMLLLSTVGIVSAVVIYKKGINKNSLIVSLPISCLILMFIIQGMPLYKTITSIIIIPVAVYILVDILLPKEN